MDEYIEREALISEFKRLGLGENSLIEKFFADGVYSVIENFPTADVAPVVHGKNITKRHPVDEFVCSECGIILFDYERLEIDEDEDDESCYEYEFKFCPNCGAKMDEREG